MSLSQNITNTSQKTIGKVKTLFPQVSKDNRITITHWWHLLKRHLFRTSDRKKASYSIEAAVALPIFMGFVVCIMFFIRVLMVEWTIDCAMTEAVDTIAVSDDEPSVYAAQALFYEKLLTGDIGLDPIQGGVLGINLFDSSVDKKNVTLSASYRVGLPIRMFSHQGIYIHQKKSARIWNGYDPHEDSGDEKLVYVTPYGRAYHLSRTCPYINPSIVAVKKSEVSDRKNNGGHRYSICPMCGGKAQDTVYITSWGECYHSSVDCSGLKRTLNMIKLSEAKEKYHECPKCGGG